VNNILVGSSPGEGPLPDDVIVRLRSDPTAALAAALIVAGAFPDTISWAARTICGSSSPSRRGGGGPGADQSNGAGGAGTEGSIGGGGAFCKSSKGPRSPTQAEERLLALMRANRDATIARLAELSGRSRPAIVMCLKRFEEAGLVDHGGRAFWTVADADPLDEAPISTSRWITPLSGKHIARFAADKRVREDMATMELS
jgi:hypothetical protein